jgi:hypothetical protein
MPSIDFCLEIAEKITSEHNQHATLLVWAPTGAGKSWAGIAICEMVSQYVAEIKGGDPLDYFDTDNIAIITQEEVLRLLSTKMDKRYSSIMCDDIGVGWSARDFMQQFNQSMNDIYQTFRTRNNFLCVTLPDPMLIDKVPRELVKYVMKVQASHHDFGYVECKIQQPMKTVQWGQKVYPYLLDFDGQRIVRHMIFRPSQHLIDNYEPRRRLIEKQNTSVTIEGMQSMVANEMTIAEPRISKKALFSEPMKADYADGNGMSMHAIAKKYGCSTQTVHEALHYQPVQK